MTLFDAMSSAFAHYADFNGRARRAEYWYFVLFNTLVTLIAEVLIALIDSYAIRILLIGALTIYGIVLIVPGLSLCWRRLHDIGRSGASYLFVLIPIVGPILLLVWFATPGQVGRNEYGPDPLRTDFGESTFGSSSMTNNVTDPFRTTSGSFRSNDGYDGAYTFDKKDNW